MERHNTDAVSLVFGLLFTAVAVIGLTDVLRLTAEDVRWIAPGLLVLLGLVLVLSAGFGRSRRAADRAEGTDPRAGAQASTVTAVTDPVPPVDTDADLDADLDSGLDADLDTDLDPDADVTRDTEGGQDVQRD